MSSDALSPQISKPALWGGWILTLLVALALLFSAAMKFVKPEGMAEGLEKMGLPESLLVTLGIVEGACALIYLFPRTNILGAVLITGYLGGAIATHARVGDPVWVSPAILGVLAWLGPFLREPRLRALLPWRR